jgi:HK97 family phage portal protein
MNIGPITISLKQKQPAAATAALTIASSGSPSSMLFNRHDDLRTNLSFIRETVSAAMHARSEAIGRGKLHGYTISSGHRKQLDHTHPIERVLASPNPLVTGSDLLELISQWLDATGNALLLKVRNGFGIVSELWLLPATNFIIERGADELPQYYKFLPTNNQIPASDIIHIKRPDIRTSPFYGHAIISDMIETAKTDVALRLYQQRFFDNDASPRAYLKFPKGATLTQEQIDQIKSAWEAKYRGPQNAGKLSILHDGGEIVPVASGAKEMDFNASRLALRDAIRESFKVPKIVLGDTDAVNLANAETSYRVFMRDVVDYILGKIAASLTKGLATEFPEHITIEHEEIIPESEEKLLGRLKELKQVLTIDEQRKLMGMPALGAGKGNRFIIGSAIYDERLSRTSEQ